MESLSKQYHKETGLHSHYVRTSIKGKKTDLAFTRKYVWWLEMIIKDARTSLENTSISEPLEGIDKTYKILCGE